MRSRWKKYSLRHFTNSANRDDTFYFTSFTKRRVSYDRLPVGIFVLNNPNTKQAIQYVVQHKTPDLFYYYNARTETELQHNKKILKKIKKLNIGDSVYALDSYGELVDVPNCYAETIGESLQKTRSKFKEF